MGRELAAVVCGVTAFAVGLCFVYQLVYLAAPFFLRKKGAAPPPAGSGGDRTGGDTVGGPAGGAETSPTAGRRYAALVAARSEEAVLPLLLDSIARQHYPAGTVDVYVGADNCTDNTAEAARRHGATVYERRDDVRIGKGYVLDFLLHCIERDGGLDRYDAFVIFDADNLLADGYFTALDAVLDRGFEAVCGYRNSKNFAAGWLPAGYALWYLHDGCHLNASRMLLGTSCAVTGTGFALTRSLVRRMGDGWPYHTLTEDIEFNMACALGGVRIGYSPDAVVYDEQPQSLRQSWRQRTRWVQGGIQLAFRYGGRLLRGMFTQKGSRFACFEALTLSIWGYLVGVAGTACGLTAALLRGGALFGCLGTALAGAYGSLFLVGVLTTMSEWRRIRASTGKKLLYLLSFPLFGLMFLPIAVYAVFAPFEWKPIHHTVAVSIRDLAG